MKRFIPAVVATALLLVVLLVGRPLVGSDAAEAAAPSGALPGGAGSPMHHIPMCFSDQCIEVTATTAGDGGVASLVANKWYEVTVSADGSGAIVGCWSNNAVITSCTNSGKPRLKDSTQKPMAFPPSIPDGGPTTNTTSTKLFFAASTSSTMTVTLCPEIPCR